MEEKVFFLFLTSVRFRRVILLFKWFFFLFLFFRTGFILLYNISELFDKIPVLSILPSEQNLLFGYLNEAQDPEWVEFVRQRLQSHAHSPRVYDILFRDFLHTEFCCSTRDQICSMYKLLFYGREDPKFFIDPSDLDLILHVHMENVEFNLSALSQVLTSLCTEGHESTFYSEVKTRQAPHFLGFWTLKEKETLEQQQREQLYRECIELEKRAAFFKEQNAFLRQRLDLPPR